MIPWLRSMRRRMLYRHWDGECPVCGSHSNFFLFHDPGAIRNDAICERCHSASRNRHLAKCVLDLYRPSGIHRLSDFKNNPGIGIFNTSSTGCIVTQLGHAPHIVCSEYFDDVPPGEKKAGILCQDLQKLAFGDGTFDLILSEDVFEHVPDYRQGFREVYRVLKIGGHHLFSIPYHFDRKTKDLFVMEQGKPRLLEPIEFHGDPVRGSIPCFTHFGYDLIDFLDSVGFETRIEISRFVDEERWRTYESFTFVTRKR